MHALAGRLRRASTRAFRAQAKSGGSATVLGTAWETVAATLAPAAHPRRTRAAPCRYPSCCAAARWTSRGAPCASSPTSKRLSVSPVKQFLTEGWGGRVMTDEISTAHIILPGSVLIYSSTQSTGVSQRLDWMKLMKRRHALASLPVWYGIGLTLRGVETGSAEERGVETGCLNSS